MALALSRRIPDHALTDIRVLLQSELLRRRELVERVGREVAAFSAEIERWRSYRLAALSKKTGDQ